MRLVFDNFKSKDIDKKGLEYLKQLGTGMTQSPSELTLNIPDKYVLTKSVGKDLSMYIIDGNRHGRYVKIIYSVGSNLRISNHYR